MNNQSLITCLLISLFFSAHIVYAQHPHPMESKDKLIEVGNKLCPVSGDKIGSMGEGVKHVYNGKIYNLCCPMCVKTFQEDPEKYSQIAEKNVHEDMIKENKDSHMNHNQEMKTDTIEEGEISHYTCGMHPSVNVSVKNYEKGDTKCPICFMPLTPVKKNKKMGGELGDNVISQVEIQVRELKLAGVKTESAKKRQLFKEIRAVGKVAFDPQMTIAQDEFISSIQSFEKSQQGNNQEIITRAQELINSSKRKLRLLGLNENQINELEQTKRVQENLILPDDKMWIYGDVYEYELNWIHEGDYVKVTSSSVLGKEFYGEIVSINPIVDPQTRSVRFRALVDNPEKRLKPEMYVNIEIMSQYMDSDGNLEVLSIPKSALLDTGRRTIVWVNKGKGNFEGRRVDLGPEAIDHSSNPRKFYPVLKGIMEGEMVVTKGNFLIDSQSQITGIATSAYGGALGDDTEMSKQASDNQPQSVHIH